MIAILLSAFAIASAPSPALVDQVVTGGCQKRLMASASHPFIEAQIACDAFLAIGLVSSVKRGHAKKPAARKLQRLFSDAVGRARSPFAKYGSETLATFSIPKGILYRGYLALILAGLVELDAATPKQERLYDAVIAAMRKQTVNGTKLAPSFSTTIWPCDNAPAASAFALYGRQRRSPAVVDVGKTLAAKLWTLHNRNGALPSKTHDRKRELKSGDADFMARGTVLAWTSAFLTLANFPEAKLFATAMRADFCDDLGVGMLCREWPRGIDRKADAVSGPIRFGYGTGATTLALAAFTAHDPAAAKKILAMGEIGGQARIANVRGFPLENSILLFAKTLTPWQPSPSPYGDDELKMDIR